MRAAVISAFGPPSVLNIREVDDPVPGTDEVLIRVHASALNRADILQRLGKYPPPPGVPTDIGGIEFAGEVIALGPGATRWRAGDRVYGIAGGGAHAEAIRVHQDTIARIPDVLDWPAAAAVPEAFITAHDALVTQALVRPGEMVMIHAVGSGVGLAAAQLAHALGARVLGTSRTADKLQRAHAYGMEAGTVVGSNLESLGEAVRRFSGGAGIDVTLDLLGGPYLPASIEVAALHGRIMLIGTIAGAQSTIDHRRILGKRLCLRGTVLRSRSLAEKIRVTQAFDREVTPLLANGTVRPVIDSVFALADIAAAHEAMESNGTFGKVVIDLS